MMSPYCKCGRFLDAIDPDCARKDEACGFYFQTWRTRNVLLTLLCLDNEQTDQRSEARL